MYVYKHACKFAHMCIHARTRCTREQDLLESDGSMSFIDRCRITAQANTTSISSTNTYIHATTCVHHKSPPHTHLYTHTHAHVYTHIHEHVQNTSMHRLIHMSAHTDTQMHGIDTNSLTPPDLMAALITEILGITVDDRVIKVRPARPCALVTRQVIYASDPRDHVH